MPIVVVGAGVPVVLADVAHHGAPARPDDLEGLNTVVLNLQDEVEQTQDEPEAAGTGNSIEPPARGRRRARERQGRFRADDPATKPNEAWEG